MTDLSTMYAYYDRGEERARLDSLLGQVEFERTTEILRRSLPVPPATVADVGGGPGRYSGWLADLGYAVEHRDLVAAHVDAVRAAGHNQVRSAVGDARDLDLGGASVDAVLLLGPVYHLTERVERVTALREARRVVRPGGTVLVSAISRWAPRLHGALVGRLGERYPHLPEQLAQVETTGVLAPLHEDAFCGYTHRPAELAAEVTEAGLDVDDLVGVEGMAFAFADEYGRLADPRTRAAVLGRRPGARTGTGAPRCEPAPARHRAAAGPRLSA